MTNPWSGLEEAYSFTSYFGTKLHGAEITWYNNPDATVTATDASELKMSILMNMYSRQYIWWDSTDATDNVWFEG